ncbi:MAG: LUD domain-containing protein [Ktedonobacteraceae bacterium]|nr:LUD domain-containing protein [Ktedonobacteraceae bacterium]
MNLSSVDERLRAATRGSTREGERSVHQRRHQQPSTRFISRWTQDKKGKIIAMTTNFAHSEFTQLASEQQIEKTVQALQAHGIRVVVCETGEEARMCVLDLIPDGAAVYDSPSRTLEVIGVSEQIEHATHFQSVRAQASTLDHVTQRNEIRKRVTAPDVLVGSVQAVTEQGEVLIASASGGQLSAAACGASLVIWVVGTHKLVGTLSDGLRRIRDYCLPLESERAQHVYGQPSAINKLLTINAEHEPGRITMVLVKQQLGF